MRRKVVGSKEKGGQSWWEPLTKDGGGSQLTIISPSFQLMAGLSSSLQSKKCKTDVKVLFKDQEGLPTARDWRLDQSHHDAAPAVSTNSFCF